MTRVRFEEAGVHTARGKSLLGPFTLEAHPGRTLVVCGETGAGKSLLIELACGMRRPSTGRVTLNDRDAAGLRPAARNTGLLTQDAALYDHLGVRGNIGFGLRKGDDPARIEQAASIAGCRELLENTREPVRSLSGGERRRVALAKAIAPDPDLLLLDEPFSGLDHATHHALRAHLRAECQRREGTTIIALHEIADAIALADDVALLHAGKLLQLGTPTDLLHTPASAEVARHFADPPPAALVGRINGGTLELPGGGIKYVGSIGADTIVDVLVPAYAASIEERGLTGWKVWAHESTASGLDLLLAHDSDNGTPRGGFLRVSHQSGQAPPVLGEVQLRIATENILLFPREPEMCEDVEPSERP